MEIDSPREHSAINEQVGRIISSRGFRNSIVISEFLKFIVSETLAGRQDYLKEYVIATQVLKKKPDFNPQLDAIVRIHARRLRILLEEYYENEGIQDKVRIHIPKGKYVPFFKENENQSESLTVNPGTTQSGNEIQSKPKLAILPFKSYNRNPDCEMIGSVIRHDLSIGLSGFPDLAVVSNNSADVASGKLHDINEIALHLGVDYLLNGSCMNDGNRLKVSVEFINAKNKEILWAESYFIEGSKEDFLKEYPQVIRKIISFLAGNFGLIYRNVFNKLNGHFPTDYSYVHAIYCYHYNMQHFTLESAEEALAQLHEAHRLNPHNPYLPAFIGQLTLNFSLFDDWDISDPVHEGLKYLRKAYDIDPQCQEIYKGFAWASLLQHDKKGFLRAAEQCMAINPNNATMRGDMGFGYICAGEFEKGLEYQLEAVQLNPYYPWFFCLGFSLYYLANHEYDEAYFWAYRINRPGFIWDPLIKTSVSGLLNRIEDGAEQGSLLLKMFPSFPEKAKETVGAFLFEEELKLTILSGLIKSGLKIDHVI